MRLWLLHTQSLHEPPVLLCTQFPRLRAVPWPLEAPALQSFVQQNKAVPFPVQTLDPVPPSAAEQKQRIAEWVQLKLLLDQAGQSVYSAPQIRIPAGIEKKNNIFVKEDNRMDFIKNWFVSLFSGLIPALIKEGKKEGKIGISHNKNSKIKGTKAEGRVTITGNEGLEIESGEFNG